LQFLQDISFISRGEPHEGHALAVFSGVCE
jgi:hypothetical protein